MKTPVLGAVSIGTLDVALLSIAYLETLARYVSYSLAKRYETRLSDLDGSDDELRDAMHVVMIDMQTELDNYALRFGLYFGPHYSDNAKIGFYPIYEDGKQYNGSEPGTQD